MSLVKQRTFASIASRGTSSPAKDGHDRRCAASTVGAGSGTLSSASLNGFFGSSACAELQLSIRSPDGIDECFLW